MNTQIKVGDTVVRKKEWQTTSFWKKIISEFKLPAADVKLQVVQVRALYLALKYENMELLDPIKKMPFLFDQHSFEIVPNYIVEEECDDC